MNFQNMLDLKSQSPDDLLQQLVARVRELAENDVKPFVRIAIGSVNYEGVPVRFEIIRQQSWLTLVSGPSRTFDSVTVLPAGRIDSFCLVNADNFLDILTGIDSVMFDASDAPTRSAIERLLARQPEESKEMPKMEIDWGGQEQNSAFRVVAGVVIDHVKSVFRNLLQDDIGREAVSSVKAIRLTFRNAPTVLTSRKKDVVEIAFSDKLQMRNLKAELKTQIEQQL